VILSRRGGSAPAVESGVNVTAFVASVPGGKADLRFVLVNGVAQEVVPQANRNWELFDYAVGPLNSGNGGFGWAETALINAPHIGRAGLENFEIYTVGAVTGADLNAGSGWAGAPLIAAY